MDVLQRDAHLQRVLPAAGHRPHDGDVQRDQTTARHAMKLQLASGGQKPTWYGKLIALPRQGRALVERPASLARRWLLSGDYNSAERRPNQRTLHVRLRSESFGSISDAASQQ